MDTNTAFGMLSGITLRNTIDCFAYNMTAVTVMDITNPGILVSKPSCGSTIDSSPLYRSDQSLEFAPVQ